MITKEMSAAIFKVDQLMSLKKKMIKEDNIIFSL